MTSPISFAGLSTGIDTTSLIAAIMQQASQPMVKLQNQESLNNQKSSLLTSLSTDITALSTSLSTLNGSAFQSQGVTSSDANNSYVTASATGATTGTYDVQVMSLATKAQMAIGSADTGTTPVGTGTYAIKDVSGSTKTFTIDSTNNNLSGLQSAINNSGAGVTATIVDTGKLGDPARFQLVITADSTGSNMTGQISLAGVADQSATQAVAGTYAITDQSGKVTNLTVDDTSLTGFRDAINNAGAGVTASIVDSGNSGDAGRYQLVLTPTTVGSGNINIAQSSGTNVLGIQSSANGGTSSSPGRSVFTLAQTSGTNSISIASGTLSNGILTSGGTDSPTAAKNADFTVNGIELTRSSNVVNDAVQGMTFTLKSGGQTTSSTPTTLSVSTDKTGITSALQDVVSKFNTILQLYQANSQGATYASNNYSPSSSSSSSSTSPVTPAGPLNGDPTLRSMIAGLRSSIMSIPAGLSGGNYYQSAAELGLKTNQDGTLSLDTTALGAALDTNPEAVANVFNQVNTNFQNSVLKITLPGSGSLALIQQNIQTQNSSLDLQIDSMQNRLNRQQQILQTTYANLESTVGQLQSAGQSLSSIA